MQLDMLEEDPYWDDLYCAWLEETCKCDLEEDGCSCLNFDDWFEEIRKEQAEMRA